MTTKKFYKNIAIILLTVGITLDIVYSTRYYCFSIPFLLMSAHMIKKGEDYMINNKEIFVCFIIAPLLFLLIRILLEMS